MPHLPPAVRAHAQLMKDWRWRCYAPQQSKNMFLNMHTINRMMKRLPFEVTYHSSRRRLLVRMCGVCIARIDSKATVHRMDGSHRAHRDSKGHVYAARIGFDVLGHLAGYYRVVS
ncbi:unnamed protein product [Ectocarpus sp. 13 AM-2016]